MTGGGLNWLDHVVFVVYVAGILGMSAWLGSGQESEDDYYVGGRDLPWWAVGISTAATQTSAIGFMSIPAFVAMKEGGGLRVMQQEIAVPLAIMFTMIFLLPLFRHLELISAYEYLERRFGSGVRYLVASVFLVSRGIGTAVGLYMTAIVFSTVFGLDLWITILVVGGITVIYDTLGGMKAVVYSDVVQMFILLLGAGLVIHLAAEPSGGLLATIADMARRSPERLLAIDLSKHGLGDGGDYGFWPQLLGGFFLIVAYYGCDQTQTQRELSTPSLDDTCRSLVFNAFFRFPLALLYAAIGVAMAAYVAGNPDFSARVLALGQADYMLPVFIMESVPHGLKALVFVAVLAAAMSSLDSSLNSLSASTTVDFLDPLWRKEREDAPDALLVSKVVTVLWGVAITGFAFFVGGISDTVIEAIGKVGSAFSGPILGAFVAGVMLPRASSRGVFAGVLLGVGVNLYLWVFQPGVAWIWWNLFGTVITVGVAALAGLAEEEDPRAEGLLIWGSAALSGQHRWIPVHATILAWALLVAAVLWFVPVFADLV